jgi:hypothetical protein
MPISDLTRTYLKAIFLCLLLLVTSVDDIVASNTPDPADDWLAAENNDYLTNIGPAVAKVLKTPQEKQTGLLLSPPRRILSDLFLSLHLQREAPHLFGLNRLYTFMSLQR